jgi:hypothetical protein
VLGQPYRQDGPDQSGRIVFGGFCAEFREDAPSGGQLGDGGLVVAKRPKGSPEQHSAACNVVPRTHPLPHVAFPA